jgi:chromosome segregation ATPase
MSQRKTQYHFDVQALLAEARQSSADNRAKASSSQSVTPSAPQPLTTPHLAQMKGEADHQMKETQQLMAQLGFVVPPDVVRSVSTTHGKQVEAEATRQREQEATRLQHELEVRREQEATRQREQEAARLQHELEGRREQEATRQREQQATRQHSVDGVNGAILSHVEAIAKLLGSDVCSSAELLCTQEQLVASQMAFTKLQLALDLSKRELAAVKEEMDATKEQLAVSQQENSQTRRVCQMIIESLSSLRSSV